MLALFRKKIQHKMTNIGPLWASKLCHMCQNALSRRHTLEVMSWLLEDVLGHQKAHVPPIVGQPPELGSAKASWMKTSSFFSCAKAQPIIVLSLPLIRTQQPSDGLFNPMEVRTNHVPMCTGPLGTCPSGMVLHIKNFALHGLISPGDHSNVNHISSLILSNACIKPLAYHPIAKRHYNDLLYKAEEKDKMPYWANTLDEVDHGISLLPLFSLLKLCFLRTSLFKLPLNFL
jgi:hypothetical protein